MPASASNPTHPLEALWQAPAIISVMIAGEGLALVLALVPGGQGDRWVYFGLASLMIQWIALLSLGGLFLLRRSLTLWPAHRVAWLSLALLLASTWLVGGATWLALHESWPMDRHDWQTFLLRLTAIALAVGLLGLAAFQNHWQARRLAVRAKQSELEALQARIRPHFLFNTLNTGAALVHARPGDAEHLLLDLADLFRAALSGPRDIPIADELSLARRYLEIEALRFGERLRVHWQLPETMPEVLVPALSIQPLVENAIRHGIEPCPAGGAIDIAVSVEGTSLQVVVCNDLPRPGTAATPGHQVGQSSARERIRALSNGRGRLDTRIENGRYFAVITLPL
ncbi:MAG TPA: histidine kinase [Arenimonas sp.]|uniref:sensor histidine kinase n=1 Tax=Arenimonas sp. TaxID=1872635 RepID=UPI002C2EE6EF|nr:histidine kinase [Arenimonas sp.]HMB57209.1 histidine kinase [Arenimonas sp.]